MKRIIVYTLLVGIAIVAAYLLVDYSDALSRMGFHVDTIDTPLLASLVGSLVAVGLFVVTYYSVNRWSAKREQNQIDIAGLLLKKTYESCRSYLEVFDCGAKEILIKKTDFNKAYYKDSPVTRFLEIPFSFEELIMKCANDGVVDKEQLADYLNVKSKYETYVFANVYFFDDLTKLTITNAELRKLIDEALARIS